VESRDTRGRGDREDQDQAHGGGHASAQARQATQGDSEGNVDASWQVAHHCYESVPPRAVIRPQ